jgi:YfiH family protein
LSVLEFIQPNWPVNKRVFCASTTVDGGVSQAAFMSLNLGRHVGDDPHSVDLNRRRLADEIRKLSPYVQPMTWLKQTHSTKTIILSEALQSDEIEADAVYSKKVNLPCTVMTADCMALMISNTDGTEIAAVHAGWKGLLNGVIENAIGQFSSPRYDLHVWFAPSICQKHFEIGNELAVLFSSFPSALQQLKNSDNKFLLDLIEVANIKLASLGVLQRYYSNICTYSAKNLFSHRSATHQGLSTCGRMANLILINNIHN